MAILITGGTGLIGSFVVRSLVEAGEVPVVFDIGEPGVTLKDLARRFQFVKGNIMDADLLAQTIKDHGIDRIIHLAALLQFGCERDPKKAIEINVQGTLNILEASCRMNVRKVVYASTVAIYGSQTGLIDENCPIPPDLGMYAATKLLGEVLLERYKRLYGIAYVALRFWGVYGPGETRGSGMGEVFKKIESTIFEKEVVVEEVGAEERRHLVFVKDAAQAVVRALLAKNNAHKVFNIAGGEDSYNNLAEFCRIIKRLYPSAGKVIFGKKNEGDRGKADITLARTELGYSPEYSLERGIKEDIEFFLPRVENRV